MKYLEVESEIFLEILKLPDQRVVTIVELLSPSNKAGAGRRDYLAKRHGLTVPNVHLVELDFLIGGHRLPMERPLPPGDCYALIARASAGPIATSLPGRSATPCPSSRSRFCRLIPIS